VKAPHLGVRNTPTSVLVVLTNTPAMEARVAFWSHTAPDQSRYSDRHGRWIFNTRRALYESKRAVTQRKRLNTGEVAAAACNYGPCAEDMVVQELGGNAADVRFTEAVRPRTGDEVPVCQRCEGTYGRDAFPPGTQFRSDLPK